MKQDNFTRPFLAQLRIEVEQALLPIAARHGITLNLGAVNFNQYEFIAKLVGNIKNEQSAEKDAAANERASTLLGFPRNIVGEKIYGSQGEEFTVIRIDLKKPKFPIIAENAAGKAYKFTQYVVFADTSLKQSKF